MSEGIDKKNHVTLQDLLAWTKGDLASARRAVIEDDLRSENGVIRQLFEELPQLSQIISSSTPGAETWLDRSRDLAVNASERNSLDLMEQAMDAAITRKSHNVDGADTGFTGRKFTESLPRRIDSEGQDRGGRG